MKFLSNLRTRLRKNLLKSNAGQGATEYILLLVVVVAVVLMFKGKIMNAVSEKVGELDTGMKKVTTDQ